ncbi:2808_t:CDS:2 [Funneliformis geosporum]|nr:2808_t:CDS:2 [Funneliformis geosporum]
MAPDFRGAGSFFLTYKRPHSKPKCLKKPIILDSNTGKIGGYKNFSIMKVKNLSEFFNEFKKYREIKQNVAQEDNFYDYVSIGCSLQNEEADSQGNVMATDLIEDA